MLLTKLIPKAQVYRVRVEMASFGAYTRKPSYLYSNTLAFKDLVCRRVSVQLCHVYSNYGLWCFAALYGEELAAISNAQAPSRKEFAARKKAVCKITNDEPHLQHLTKHSGTLAPYHTQAFRLRVADQASGRKRVSGIPSALRRTQSPGINACPSVLSF